MSDQFEECFPSTTYLPHRSRLKKFSKTCKAKLFPYTPSGGNFPINFPVINARLGPRIKGEEVTLGPHGKTGKTSKKATWYHPKFKTPATLDYSLVKRMHAMNVTNTLVLPGTVMDSDHKLVRTSIRRHHNSAVERENEGSTADRLDASTGKRQPKKTPTF